LHQLNKHEGQCLTIKAYQEIGKLEGALQRRADASLKALSQDEQELCRRTFLRLTKSGEGTEWQLNKDHCLVGG
jgi:hypothetical protein